MFENRKIALLVLAFLAANGAQALGEAKPDLLFHASFDRGLDADRANQDTQHRAEGSVKAAEGMKGRGVLIFSPDEAAASLSYRAQGNVVPARGTVSFWLRPAWDTSIIRAPALFTIGGILQIYYEPTVPAIVVMQTKADGKLLAFQARHRLQMDEWVHLTYTWDCEKGADLYINGKTGSHKDSVWQAPSLAADAGMSLTLTNDLGGRPKEYPLGGAVDELSIFSAPLPADRVARLFVESGGQTGPTFRYEQTVDLGTKVKFGLVKWQAEGDTKVMVRTSCGQPTTWANWTWGGPLSWSRPTSLGDGGRIESEPGRHLKLIFTFNSPDPPSRLPLKKLTVTYAPVYEPAKERTRVLDPSRAKAAPAKAIDHIPLTMAVETPHEKWAKPYSRGRIKALILTHLHNQREIIELAQRMDLQFDTASVTKYAWLLGVASRHRGGLSWSNVLAKLENDLKTNKYDVIVIGGVPWKRCFNDQVRNLLLERVKEGTGLVVILDPVDTTDALAAALPLKEFKASDLKNDPIWDHSSLIGEFRGRWRRDTHHFITAGIPFGFLPETPYFKYAKESGDVIARAGNDALVALGQYGKARVVQLTYGTAKGWGGNRSLSPHVPYDTPFHYWEYYLSLVGRSMLWAASKEPDVFIKSLTPRGKALPAQQADRGVVRLELENCGAGRSLEIDLTLRNERWQAVAHENQQLRCAAEATAATTFRIPDRLTGGKYIADVIVRDRGKVVNWGSAYFSVTPAVAIAEVAFDREVYGVDDPVNVQLQLVATTAGQEDVQVKIRVLDTYGRLLNETATNISVKGSRDESILVGNVESLTPFVKVEIELWQRGFLTATRTSYFLTSQSWRWDDYRPVIWSDFATTSVMEYLRPHYIEKFKEMGFDAMEDDSHFTQDFRFACRQNMQPFPIGFGGSTFHEDVQKEYESTNDKKHLARKPCLNDPAHLDSIRRGAAAKVEKLKHLNPLGYILADETSLTSAGVVTYPTRGVDICFSSHTLAAFRTWLKGQYGTLDALNEEWETTFESWEHVIPSTKEELLPTNSENFSSWSDHRTFMEISVYEAYKASVDALKQASPDVPVGLSGTSPPATYTGFDYSRLGPMFDTHWMYDNGSVGEMWRSFNPGASYIAAHGYGQGRVKRIGGIWDTLLHGHKGTLQWTMPIFVNPDLTLSPHGEDLKSWHRELRSGLGKIIIQAKLTTEPIAIVYSQRGIQAAWITGAGKGEMAVTRYESLYRTKVKGAWISANEVRHLDNMDTYCNLLEAANLQYDFVTAAQVAGGQLQKRPYRVLILPWMMPMSTEQEKEIREFVRGGGLLITDVLPGIMDGHCKTLPAGRLDDVFGVKSAGYHAPKLAGKIACMEGAFPKLRLGDTLHNVLAGPEVVATTAESRGTFIGPESKRRAIFTNRYGKGRAVLLNFLLSNEADDGTWANQASFLAQLLAESNIRPRADIVVADNEFIPYYEPMFYRQGTKLEYLAVLRQRMGGRRQEDITIQLEEPHHVYDVRKRKYLGQTRSVKTSIHPGEAAVFALYPYQVKGLSLQAPRARKAGEAVNYTVKVDTAPAGAGDQIVRLEVYDGSGKLVEPYSGNLLSKAGVVKGAFKLALNDPAGRWRLKAIDVVSGATVEENLLVRPDD